MDLLESRIAAFDAAAVAQLLFTSPALATQTNLAGETAMHLAAKFGSAPLLRLLSQCGCDCDARDRLGRTPIRVAAGWELQALDAVCMMFAHWLAYKYREYAPRGHFVSEEVKENWRSIASSGRGLTPSTISKRLCSERLV